MFLSLSPCEISLSFLPRGSSFGGAIGTVLGTGAGGSGGAVDGGGLINPKRLVNWGCTI